jgi:hypothetical protein
MDRGVVTCSDDFQGGPVPWERPVPSSGNKVKIPPIKFMSTPGDKLYRVPAALIMSPKFMTSGDHV